MVIILLGGGAGSGKTYGLDSFDEPIAHADTEYPRAKIIVDEHYSHKLIDIYQCREFYKEADKSKGIKKGQIDVDATFKCLMESIDTILEKSDDYTTIGIDGVSDIRTDIVAAHWLNEWNKNNPSRKRKVIGDNPTAWSEINKIVGNQILFPLINTCRMEGKTLILTSRMTDDRKLVKDDEGKEHSIKTGKKIIEANEWLEYEMDVKAVLSKENGRYYIAWDKTFKNDLPAKEDITGRNLYDVFVSNGMM